MKIVISGPAGSGKTTLARALAAHTGLPLIEEGLSAIYQAKAAFRELAARPQTPPKLIEQALLRWMSACFDWLDERDRQYRQAGGFIADRWEADLLGVWLRVFTRYRPDTATLRIRQRMLERAATLDLVVVLPWRETTVEAVNEQGLRRQQSASLGLMAGSLLHGLIAPCEAVTKLYLAADGSDLSARMSRVLEAMATLAQSRIADQEALAR
jgi:adenylate kinase family enzyme